MLLMLAYFWQYGSNDMDNEQQQHICATLFIVHVRTCMYIMVFCCSSMLEDLNQTQQAD
jgi:hypothetical protein